MVSRAAPHPCHVPVSAGGALAFLEIVEERGARLLKLLPYHLQDAGPARLQFRCRLAVDSHARPAQLLGAERDRRALHGVHEIPERFVLLCRNGGVHLPQQRLAVLDESVEELRHEGILGADELKLGERRRIDDRLGFLGAVAGRRRGARALRDQAGDGVEQAASLDRLGQEGVDPGVLAFLHRLRGHVRRKHDDRDLYRLRVHEAVSPRSVQPAELGHVEIHDDHVEPLVLQNIERFDVIIMDLNMPELGGLDAARAYRFMDPEAIQVPIIMLSADVTSEAMKECEDAGIDAFLPKPIEARRLLDTIASLIAKRSTAQAVSGDGSEETQAVINSAALAELALISSDNTFMPELLNGFIQDGEALLRQMEAAVAAEQYETLRDLVHALKGSAVTLGAEQLCRTCVGINAQTTSELQASGPRVLKVVREQFQQARASLLDYLKKSQSAAR